MTWCRACRRCAGHWETSRATRKRNSSASTATGPCCGRRPRWSSWTTSGTTTDIEPFLAESPRSRLLFTTRDASIAAAVVGSGASGGSADGAEQSRALLARWAGYQADDLPAEALDLIRECGRLPLALSMIGAMLRGKPAAYWGHVLRLLRTADLARIRRSSPTTLTPTCCGPFRSAWTRSMSRPVLRYLALAVLLEDMPVRPAVQQALWGVDEGDASKRRSSSSASRWRSARRRRHPSPRPATRLRARAVQDREALDSDPRCGSALLACHCEGLRAVCPADGRAPPAARDRAGDSGVSPIQLSGWRARSPGFGRCSRRCILRARRCCARWKATLLSQWRGGEPGRAACRFRFLGQHAEGVGPGKRARTAHAGRPLCWGLWRGGDPGRAACRFRF